MRKDIGKSCRARDVGHATPGPSCNLYYYDQLGRLVGLASAGDVTPVDEVTVVPISSHPHSRDAAPPATAAPLRPPSWL
jgi:hypothetical protein